MSDNFRRCPACGEYGWFDNNKYLGSHVCKPLWEARMVGADDNEWSQVHAYDAENAAEKFCEKYDCDGEYTVIQRGSAEVEVRKPGDDAITRWDISAESVPQYRAYASDSTDDVSSPVTTETK